MRRTPKKINLGGDRGSGINLGGERGERGKINLGGERGWGAGSGKSTSVGSGDEEFTDNPALFDALVGLPVDESLEVADLRRRLENTCRDGQTLDALRIAEQLRQRVDTEESRRLVRAWRPYALEIFDEAYMRAREALTHTECSQTVQAWLHFCKAKSLCLRSGLDFEAQDDLERAIFKNPSLVVLARNEPCFELLFRDRQFLELVEDSSVKDQSVDQVIRDMSTIRARCLEDGCWPYRAPAAPQALVAWERQHKQLPDLLRAFLTQITAGESFDCEYRGFVFADGSHTFCTVADLSHRTLSDAYHCPPADGAHGDILGRLSAALPLTKTTPYIELSTVTPLPEPLNFLVLRSNAEAHRDHSHIILPLSGDGATERVYRWDYLHPGWPGTLEPWDSLRDLLYQWFFDNLD